MNNNDRLRLPAAHRLRPLAITVAVFSLTSIMAGCYDANNERMYPYQFETVRSFGRGWVIADLNFDGSDEVIYRVRSTSETANEAWAARVEGWASKRWGDDWEYRVGWEDAEEDFESWLNEE